MMALIFEIMGAIDFILAIYFWIMDHNDINHWLPFLLISIIMYLNAMRYEDNE